MWNLPNIITVARILISPVIALLPFIEGYTPKLVTLGIFIAAVLSDVWDGHLARTRNMVTDLGKLLDPLADKLLLLATLIPIYAISQERNDLYGIPVWGSIPLWVCLLLLGRELAMTLFRWYAKNRGVVIAATSSGKLKTTFQSIFIGATIAWFAFKDAVRPMGWEGSSFARFWTEFHGGFVAITLAFALVLTLWSFALYLIRNRAVFSSSSTPSA